LPTVDVVILYPEGRVSEVQRRQMSTVPDANIRAVAVRGTFDDCQDLVKAAFGDPELRRRHRLAAVNSINWARVMCQAAYYVWTTRQLGEIAVAVPTGNFGNVLAAWVAIEMGAPIARLVVGTNANHTTADIIETGRMSLGPVQQTLAPAMDIQISSNFERYLFESMSRDGSRVAQAMTDLRSTGLLALDELAHARMRKRFEASWFDDAQIERTIETVHREHGLTIDPHTATGWAAADAYTGDLPTVVVATAHPAKFPEAVARATGETPLLPDDLADLMDRPERFETIDAELGAVAQLLLRDAPP
jgi:threonine synthase